jgi:RNA polymerase sigma-70 factor, ECF subfamily
MAESDDERLGRQLACGSEEAFAALYDRFAPRLYRAAFALLDNRHDAEDAVQGVFVGLARSRNALARVKNWHPYLLAALRNEAARLGMRRRQQREWQPLEDSHLIAAPKSGPVSLEARLENALKRLPEEQRQVVRLKTEVGLTFAEIAALLQISLNTAASRFRYAIDKLRRELEEEER